MSCRWDAVAFVEEPDCIDAPSADLARRFMKLDHLGESIAVNIYCSQRLVARLTCPGLAPMLEEFLAHEKRHLRIFQSELARRGVGWCRGLRVLGGLGFVLGVLTALLGKQAVLACTAAVETVVLGHLNQQLAQLAILGDQRAVEAITSIVEDEATHRQLGAGGGGFVYRCVYAFVAFGTATVIRVGLHL